MWHSNNTHMQAQEPFLRAWPLPAAVCCGSSLRPSPSMLAETVADSNTTDTYQQRAYLITAGVAAVVLLSVLLMLQSS